MGNLGGRRVVSILKPTLSCRMNMVNVNMTTVEQYKSNFAFIRELPVTTRLLTVCFISYCPLLLKGMPDSLTAKSVLNHRLELVS